MVNSPSGRHPRIKHLGFVQVKDMPAVMEQCGVFVLPSSYEPWGVVVHEHACAGFPMVLSSAVGAGDRFLTETGNGFRFISGDAGTLSSMLRMTMLSTDAELLGMGRRSAELGAQWNPKEWALVVMDLIKARRHEA